VRADLGDEISPRLKQGGHRLIHGADGLNTGVWPMPADYLVTPTDLFFTRSHAPVPQIDIASWRLEVGGLVDSPGCFSFDDLTRRFARREVTATVVCAGLRREEFLSLGALPGELPWGPEPASTGLWAGIALGEVLHAVGFKEGGRHVEFTGLDEVERQDVFGFGGSIDLTKALGAEVLLATELNGEPLPPEHGFPLRAVVPGWIGARSVKWLGRIRVLAEPSSNYFQSRAYRLQWNLNPSDPRDVTNGVPLSVVPLNSVILEPTANGMIAAGRVQVRGWAMGSGGCPLRTVELSPDAGHTWRPARIVREGENWAWSFWEGEFELPRGRHVLVVRATDSIGTTQPATVRETWNVKGYNNNAWHRVAVRAE
jgi:sulfite oxidase